MQTTTLQSTTARPHVCRVCGQAFDGYGVLCPAHAIEAAQERARIQAQADKRQAIRCWRIEQEKRQRRLESRTEWKEAV